MAPVAELVDALELKIEFRKECWFDSGQGHQITRRLHLYGPRGDYSARSTMSSRWIISARPVVPSTASISRELRPTSCRAWLTS